MDWLIKFVVEMEFDLDSSSGINESMHFYRWVVWNSIDVWITGIRGTFCDNIRALALAICQYLTA